MKLADLIEGVPPGYLLRPEWGALDIEDLEYDSRKVKPGDGFFAFSGARTDGRQFAQEALLRGAVAVFSENEAPAGFEGPWIRVEHARRTMAAMSRRLYGAPDASLAVTGVTGTNGKTTTVFALDSMLRHAGRTTGMVGTILYRVAGKELPAVNTTPDSLDLMRLMDTVRKAGGTHFSFEASSHALALERVSGISFAAAVFTNLTRDHLDFHGTMEEYFEAKQRLFDGAGGPPPRVAVINADDEWGRKLRTHPGTERLSYGLRNGAALRATEISAGFDGIRFTIEHAGGRQRIESRLCGLINVYNLTAAFGAGLAVGLSAEEAAAGVAAGEAVPGRFERIDEGQPFLVAVDYAHTDDALKNTISVARALKPKRVITLFGCGGDRDRAKRPLMGQAAAELSDYVVVTSDNPRSEDPLAIINDALVGVRRTETPHTVEPDREKAIRKALAEAAPGDVVLLAGKGHETYQVLRDKTIAFDDRAVARQILRSYGYSREAGR
ncbi:MAG: UDP-N-acetylmuramoyl-L-alanyl-D-glutamate--2,6-diaminopimelate ligase [Acidobacteria bacterium]|nr:UDP-N-acetylmuramoyl-L-alanyl-D-glutamate--2,6-diaminopimelate ligase [Acidobacteriota bacterium]